MTRSRTPAPGRNHARPSSSHPEVRTPTGQRQRPPSGPGQVDAVHPRVAQHDHVQQVAKPDVGQPPRLFGKQPGHRQATQRPGQPSPSPDRLWRKPREGGDELGSRLVAELVDLLLVVSIQTREARIAPVAVAQAAQEHPRPEDLLVLADQVGGQVVDVPADAVGWPAPVLPIQRPKQRELGLQFGRGNLGYPTGRGLRDLPRVADCGLHQRSPLLTGIADRRPDLPDSYRQSHPVTGTYRFPPGFLPVHPTCHYPNPNPLVTGPTIRLAARHAKTRRGGYRKT